MADAFENMDRMFRFQRYFYDVTRKYYLLGRDQLIREIAPKSGEHILEIGCGTGRNLIILAKRHPRTHFYGLDASAAMLETARKNINLAGLSNITLKTALADDFLFDTTFKLGKRFDKIFFSYSISMIPPWRESIENALENLKLGGELFIVDFYDQKDMPEAFRKLLQWWLSKFHVTFWEGLQSYLHSLETAGRGEVTITALFRRYSFLARVIKAG